MSDGAYGAHSAARGAGLVRDLRRTGHRGHLLISEASCLRLRSTYSDCSACGDACPADAIRIDHASIEVTEACFGCGRCASVCPTGALLADLVPDLSRWGQLALAVPVLEIECTRVPPRAIIKGALRVPCTGSLGAHDLLGLYADRRCQPVRVIDRGLCGNCAASDEGRHPAVSAINAARCVLEEFGPPHDDGVALALRELPQGERALPPPHADPPPDSSRREFLRRAAGVSPTGPAGVSLPRPAARLFPVPRARLIAALERIAKSAGGVMPARLFPRIKISDRCADHGVCAAVCPTGALARYEKDGAAGLQFEAAACIACGDCTRACSEQALVLVPQGDGEARSSTATLTRRTLRECYDCGHEFTDTASSSVCPTCQKARELARAGFSQLFGAARNPHVPMEPPSETDRPGLMYIIEEEQA